MKQSRFIPKTKANWNYLGYILKVGATPCGINKYKEPIYPFDQVWSPKR